MAVLATSHDGAVSWIDQLYVLPGYVLQGIGTRLLASAHAELPPPIRLYTFQLNALARRFYERRGYEACEFTDGSSNEEKCPNALYEFRPNTAARPVGQRRRAGHISSIGDAAPVTLYRQAAEANPHNKNSRSHMDNFIELDTIAVVAITLAALTSILAALRGGHWHEWGPRFRLGFWMLVQYSLGAVGFALLPSLLRDFGITSWGGAFVVLVLFQVTSAVHFLRRNVRLERSGITSHSRTLWIVGSVIMFLTPAALTWSLFGGLGGPTYYLYHFGVSICLLASLGAFVGFLRLDPRDK